MTYTLKHRHLREGEFWCEIPAFAKVSQNEFLDYKWQIKNIELFVDGGMAQI
ncbi:hypothetical protein NUACC21_27250 [Scytonema sp. NUACC21]